MVNTTEHKADVVIIGGGMVGASLALALKGSGLSVGLIESQQAVDSDNSAPVSFDERHLALSQSSRRILAAIGVWSELGRFATPIQQLHVSEKGRFAQTRMHAEEIGLDALGYVIIARALGQTLWQQLLQQSYVTVFSPATVESFEQDSQSVRLGIQHAGKSSTLAASLCVFADGSESEGRDRLGLSYRRVDYHQTAMVATVSTERPHQFTAYERFTPQGPFALLPKGPDKMGMVFCLPTEQARKHLELGDEEFMQAANERFGRRLGRFTAIGQRHSYPLQLLDSAQHFQGRSLILGNAAHTIHPNGAQGLNLCLRDVAGLRDTVLNSIAEKQDIGSRQCLQAYMDARIQDQQRVVNFSDGLVEWFYNDKPVKKCLRSLGMTGIECIKPVKQHLALQSTGLQGHQPEWVQGAS